MAGYFSEITYTESQDNFIEVAVPAGTDVSGYQIAIYDGSGVLQTTMSFGSPDATIAGQDIYSFDQTSPGYAQYGASEAIALIDGSGNVVQFVSFEGKTVTAAGGPAAGETSTSLGFLNSGESFETTDGGATYAAQTTPNQGTIPCYGAGTLIDTAQGPVPVERLRPGDRVWTEDRGLQPVLWVSRAETPLEPGSGRARPVLIRRHALGPGRPARDLVVSPQHRILVGAHGQLHGHFAREAFVPAKSLVSLPGIRFMNGPRSVTWFHFACPGHEVVRANGIRSESLFLGRMVLAGAGRRKKRDIERALGRKAVDFRLHDRLCRPCLTCGEVAALLAASREEAQLAG